MQPDQSSEQPAAPASPVPAPIVAPVSDPEPVSDQSMADSSTSRTSPSINDPVHWQATEYIHHERNTLWFVAFGIIVLAFMVIAILLIKSITFAILIPVMAAALLVYTHRPPRVLDYTLSGQGLHINDKLYPLTDYKGFGIVHDTGEFSVMLVPVKRFRPGVTVYFPEEAGEAIVDLLGARLPMQELHLDTIDRVIRKLRI